MALPFDEGSWRDNVRFLVITILFHALAFAGLSVFMDSVFTYFRANPGIFSASAITLLSTTPILLILALQVGFLHWRTARWRPALWLHGASYLLALLSLFFVMPLLQPYIVTLNNPPDTILITVLYSLAGLVSWLVARRWQTNLALTSIAGWVTAFGIWNAYITFIPGYYGVRLLLVLHYAIGFGALTGLIFSLLVFALRDDRGAKQKRKRDAHLSHRLSSEATDTTDTDADDVAPEHKQKNRRRIFIWQ